MAKTLINAIQVCEFCALRDEAERGKEPWTTRNAVGLVSYNMVHQYSTCSFKRTLTLSWQFIFISVLNVKLDLQTPEYKVQELSVQSLGPGSDIPSATCMHHAQSAVNIRLAVRESVSMEPLRPPGLEKILLRPYPGVPGLR